MQVKITNDGKEKRQSWEANLYTDFSELGYFGSLEVIGYGATEEEAKQDLREKLVEAQKVLMDWIMQTSNLKV